MFDAVLREQERELRYGAGLALALLAHAAAFALATAFLPTAGRSERLQSQFPVLLESVSLEPAPPPPPPPAGPAAPESAPSRAVVRPTPKPVEPKPVEAKPAEKPIEKEVEPEPVEKEVTSAPETPPRAVSPSPAAEAPGGGGVAGGVSGGVQGGVVGGRLGGVVGSTGTGTQVLPFGPGMTRPQQIGGTTPSYSREALAARVEGKVLVRCVIQTSGEVKDCQVLKGVPMLTDVVLASLRTSRFTPVVYRGLPQAIQYLFTFNFKLP